MIEGASAADGPTAVMTHLGGNETNLGNPVDLAFDGFDLYVAEKSNASGLVFESMLSVVGAQNILSTGSAPIPAAESLFLRFD